MTAEEKVILETLRTVIEDEGIKNPNIKIKAISMEGANYTATLHYITIKSPGRDDLELFAKVCCVGEEIRNLFFINQPTNALYVTEPFAYRELFKFYNNLQTQNNVPVEERLLFPKFYTYNDKYLEETIIFENLAAKGYTMYDRFELMTWDYAAKAVSELAKLHSLSYALAEYHPREFNTIVKELPNIFLETGELMFQMWKKSEANALNAIPKEYRARLRDFFFKESTMGKYNKYYTSPRRPVLVHGDYRCCNLMHTTRNGEVDKLIPVDYQTLHAGSQVVDLLFFIFSGSDGEFRKTHYQRLIELYYTTFEGFITKLNLNPKKIYPKEHFYNELRDNLPFGLLYSTFGLPRMLSRQENTPSTAREGSVDNFIVKSNEMFEKRFRDAFDDFVRWGVV